MKASPEPIPADDPRFGTHLTGHKVRPLPDEPSFVPPEVVIETENFGQDRFRLGQPFELLIPAVKTVLDEEGNPVGPSRGSLEGTHFLCYAAASGLQNLTTTLDDQFGREEVLITKLEQFCLPVGKNEPAPVVVENPAFPETWSHLACYSVLELSGPTLPLDVNVVDQFAPAPGVIQRVEEPRRFCEPAIKLQVIQREEREERQSPDDDANG